MAEHVDTAELKLNASDTESASVAEAMPDDVCADVKDAAKNSNTINRILFAGCLLVVTVAALGGWLGVGAYHEHQARLEQSLYLATGRQAALDLTTISYSEVDADLARILDSATGRFRDDFKMRSQPFIDVVKQAQSKSEGNVTEAALESQHGDQAAVLVAVSVNTSNASAQQQPPRAWRMRISLQRVGDSVKVSDVQFVT